MRAFFHQLNGKVARTTQVCPSSKKYLLQTLVLHENMRREVKQFLIQATTQKVGIILKLRDVVCNAAKVRGERKELDRQCKHL